MVKSLDCGIVVNEFELQLHYYVHFRTNTLGKDMRFFLKDGFGIKQPMKVDMSLKQRN